MLQQLQIVISESTLAVLEAKILIACVIALEVSLARRQNLKLAWENAWNHRRIKLTVKWLSHRSVRP